MQLVRKKTQEPVKIGDAVIDFRGEPATITGWAEPRSPASSGRVYVSGDGFNEAGGYPSVYDLEWIGRTDR